MAGVPAELAGVEHGARVVPEGTVGQVLGQLGSHSRERLLLSLGQGHVGELDRSGLMPKLQAECLN
jgi:hypothetical protein